MIVPVWTFVAHATLVGACLAIACGILSGGGWNRYQPGWFGLGVSIVFLAVFYSQQVKALGARPMIVLPLLVGGVLGLLWWTKEKNVLQKNQATASKRWRSATAVMVMPATASLGYAFQRSIETKGINPGWIFYGLAFAGGAAFITACGLTLKRRVTQALPALKVAAGDEPAA